jgi:myo-inositol-1(or 4)-monophosphatase
MHQNYERIVSTICEWGDRIVGEAGRVADIGVKKRWLTEFDLAIERAVAHEISLFSGRHILFAEEEHTSKPEGESIWILDPVSSTKSFIRGIPLFSTVISHVQNGVTAFAAVYDPNRRELFTAKKGKGSYLGEKRLSVEEPSSDLFLHCMPAHKSFSKERCVALYSDLLDLGSVRMSGMSEGLAYSYVACGRFSGAVCGNVDVFPAWAGRLLVEEAGGVFTDFGGGTLGFEPHGTVSGSRVVHAELVKRAISFSY